MKKKWFRLDNAALIFPAVMRRRWNNVFRLSVTLSEPIDPVCLARALEDLRPRFPSFFVRLRTGFFWYYLEEIKKPIRVREEYAYPLTHMSQTEIRTSCLRVLYYENRIAVEFFHSVTDGTGGLLFIRNLTARYLSLRYGIDVPYEDKILDPAEPPLPAETEDCFQKCSAKFAANRREETVYRLRGTPESDRFRHLTTGILPTDELCRAAHEHNATVTAFLAAVMAETVQKKQAAEVSEKHWKPVKITVPVNLRRLFGVDTFRNFVLTLNAGVDPKTGDYSLDELCRQMTHQLAAEAVPQKMAARIAANVLPENNPVIRVMPLPVKNLVMRLVYADTGERKGCLNVSNLGVCSIPDVMRPYVERFEFIIGVQYSYPNNCSVVSYGGKTYINMIRSIRESELERLFFSRLVELGVPVDIESNRRRDPSCTV